MQEKIKFLVPLAVVLLLVLGYVFYYKQWSSLPGTPGSSGGVVTTTPPSTPSAASSEEEKVVAAFPTSSSTEQEHKDYFKSLLPLMRTGVSLEVSNCKVNPLIYSIKKDLEFGFHNGGANKVTIDIGVKQYEILANSTTTAMAGFGKGSGIYRYTCHSGTSKTGVIVVTDDN